MLQLRNIRKDYIVADTQVHALKGIDLEFRESEFVAILGHSGCGKTTLLNIIGGLDRFTGGDLVIGGRSTKQFKDSDWDTYRNHAIGFVFQSYNLIPHQTVLQNVELALTISGVGRAERRRRAEQALRRVGLGDQLLKKPNQMSGGQMQRVAIARALVNNPSILLADEPTGALDTETSVQIMELLKQISRDRLIIMVTHNPELAEQYAGRIIRLKDGLVTADSDPFTHSSPQADGPLPPSGHGRPLASDSSRKKRTGKRPRRLHRRTSMGFATALSLSLNNLLTKKARTLLTSFAGSIGIIGIALIMSLSNGIQNYIDKVQEDTLSSYPITIQAETVDMTGMMTSLMGIQASTAGNRHDRDAVYSSTIMSELMNSMVNAEKQTNNLRDFKAFLDADTGGIRSWISSVQYSYDLDMNLYAEDPDGNIVKTDIVRLLQETMSSIYGGNYSSFFSTYGQMYSVANVWQEMLPGESDGLINPLLKDQYDLLYGHWPENWDEAVLVVDENNEISDLVLYALGLKSNSTITEDRRAFLNASSVETKQESWTYAELCEKSFRYIFPADTWAVEDGETVDLTAEQLGLRTLYREGLEVKLVGVIRQNADALSGMMTGAIGYTHALVEHIIDEAATKDLVRRQLQNPEIDVFSGLPFLDDMDEAMSREKKSQAARDHIAAADEAEIARIYVEYMCEPDEKTLNDILDEQLEGMSRTDIEKTVTDYYPEYRSMLADLDDDTLFDYVRQMLTDTVKTQYAAQMRTLYENLSDRQLAADFELLSLNTDDYLWIYENTMSPVYASGSLQDTLEKLGYVDLDSPSAINLYASTFENKDRISEAIEHYNEGVSEDDEIHYTDMVALLMSSITTIINVISYVLIAFVAISLVVSSIMIGIITYISVLERTKEIGILRAIGASKQDVSRVFNAETFIVGLGAGVIGILVTVLLNIPINIIVHDLTGIMAISSSLPAAGAVFLILISVVLTFIAGLIPSGVAAKKDPVIALRSE